MHKVAHFLAQMDHRSNFYGVYDDQFWDYANRTIKNKIPVEKIEKLPQRSIYIEVTTKMEHLIVSPGAEKP